MRLTQTTHDKTIWTVEADSDRSEAESLRLADENDMATEDAPALPSELATLMCSHYISIIICTVYFCSERPPYGNKQNVGPQRTMAALQVTFIPCQELQVNEGFGRKVHGLHGMACGFASLDR